MINLTYYSAIYLDNRTVKAVARANLALHCAEFQDGMTGPIYADGWNVTHTRSGVCIIHCKSIWKARRAMRALLRLGLWDFDMPIRNGAADLTKLDPRFVNRAKAVYERFNENA
jgi:hypothetical protein